MRTATDSAQQNGHGRLAPHNLSVEESALGAMLLSREAVDAVIGRLGVDGAARFYMPAHGHVYEAIVRLAAVTDQDGRPWPVDPITVAHELERSGLLEAAGGAGALIALQASAPAISNARRHAELVAELAELRAWIGRAAELAEAAHRLEELDRIAAMVEGYLADCRLSRAAEAESVFDVMVDAYAQMQAAEAGTVALSVPTPWRDVNTLTGGVSPTAMVIGAGRPGSGKTVFGCEWAVHTAVQLRRPALFCSLEMGRVEVMMRILASIARVDYKRMRTGGLSPNDWQRIDKAADQVGDAPLYLLCRDSLTVADVQKAALQIRRRDDDLGCVVVDYVGLMSGPAGENRQQEVASISKGLKQLALKLTCPVVALVQINRGAEKLSDKRPVVSDLRDSGQLEADADTIVLLYRDELYYPDSPDRGMCEAIVGKHRHGPTGMVKLAFVGHWVRLADLGSVNADNNRGL